MNPGPTMRLIHHRTGITVTVGMERSQHKTLLRARRILSARVYAHDKGVATLDKQQHNVENYNLNPDGTLSTTVGPNTYTITVKE